MNVPATVTATVTSPDGDPELLRSTDEDTLMELIRDNGMPLLASCGGQLACATCHIYVADDWLDRLPPRSEDELDLLQTCDNYDPLRSRLSCQIQLGPEMDGIAAEIAPEG